MAVATLNVFQDVYGEYSVAAGVSLIQTADLFYCEL